MKIFIADDAALLRAGLAGLLERQGHEIVGHAHDAPSMEELVRVLGPAGIDVLITDVRMPPNMSDDGLKSAVRLREDMPDLSVMVLSQYVAPVYAVELFHNATAGTGYLLKDRVAEVADFLSSLQVVASGGTVIDPDVASALISAGRGGLNDLTPREKEVLELMSRGKSNRDIAQELVLSSATVAKHVYNIFMKLHLQPEEENRRVKAILQYLSAGHTG
ncbi:LuxR C-terminal-related transcriptional regulator [Corynebacterium cystitidis]|uniref:LuxR C-terminal-related transcriptional regulator n=1 Tax=Corynebacterium cystitidis TaxID=35757 RepID=UPI00211DB202|nr:response regulator transcription factor [Corynebacterium cystitidis]